MKKQKLKSCLKNLKSVKTLFGIGLPLLASYSAYSAGITPIAGNVIGKSGGVFDPSVARVLCNPRLNQSLCYGPDAPGNPRVPTKWSTFKDIEPLVVPGQAGSWIDEISASIELEPENWADSHVRATNILPVVLTKNATVYFPGNTVKVGGKQVPAPSYMADFRHVAQESDGNYYPHPLTSVPEGVQNPNMLKNDDYCPGFGLDSANPIKIKDVGLCPSSIFEFGHRDANNNLLPIKQTLCTDMKKNVMPNSAPRAGSHCADTQVINYNPQGTCQRESAFTTMDYELYWKTINRLPQEARPYLMFFNTLNGWVEWEAGMSGLESGNKLMNLPGDTKALNQTYFGKNKARFGAAVHRMGMRDTNTGLYFMLPNITSEANQDAQPNSGVASSVAAAAAASSFSNWDFFVDENGQIKPEYSYLLEKDAVAKDLQFGVENYRTHLKFSGEFDNNYGPLALKQGSIVSCGRGACGNYNTVNGVTSFAMNQCGVRAKTIQSCIDTRSDQCIYVPDVKVGTKTYQGCSAIQIQGNANAKLPVASRGKFYFPISGSLMNMAMMKYLGPETTGSAGELFGIYGGRSMAPVQVRDAFVDYCVKTEKGDAVANLLKSNIYTTNWVRGINYCNEKHSFAEFLKAYPKTISGKPGTLMDLVATMPAVVRQAPSLGDHSLAKIGWIFHSSRTSDDYDRYRAYWIIQNSSGPFSADHGSSDVGIYFGPQYCMQSGGGVKSVQYWANNPECYYPQGMQGTRNYVKGVSYTTLNSMTGQRLIIDYTSGKTNGPSPAAAKMVNDASYDPTAVLEEEQEDDDEVLVSE